ncbi:MAG TPA: Trm112 family protein [Terracidiphilus sp.]|jgi:hypothetical protein
MPAAANPNLSFDVSVLESILGQLACPACLGDLRLADNRLVCAACGRSYPIVDGIPVLIVDRARDAHV